MLSVALASCNGARFILEQANSILGQIEAGDELVVSDDASSDATLDVLRCLGDSRVRILQNADRVGYIKNFERAVRECRGDSIFFSDQDDVWLPGKVKAMLVSLERSACVVSDARVVTEDLHLIDASYFKLRRVRSFSPLAILWRPPIVGATMACRRDFLERLLPFPDQVPHDFWITFNAALSRQLDVLPEPLILYRRHGAVASLSASGSRRSMLRVARERIALARALIRRRVLHWAA